MKQVIEREKKLKRISRPAPAVIQQKADRKLAKKRAEGEADDWDGIVKGNRHKRTIVFHDQQKGGQKVNLSAAALSAKFVASDELETKLIGRSASTEDAGPVADDEDWAAKAKRRAQQMYQEEKYRRWRKIKSRSFRKIHNRHKKRGKDEDEGDEIIRRAQRRQMEDDALREGDIAAAAMDGAGGEALHRVDLGDGDSSDDSENDEGDAGAVGGHLRFMAEHYRGQAGEDAFDEAAGDAAVPGKWSTLTPGEKNDSGSESDSSESDPDSSSDSDSDAESEVDINFTFEDQGGQGEATTVTARAEVGHGFDDEDEQEAEAELARQERGRGVWAGAGASKRKNRRGRGAIQKKSKATRGRGGQVKGRVKYGKDATEASSFAKYEAAALHPTKSAEEHDAVMSKPLGKEWNSVANFQRLVRPAEVVRAGAAVMPLRKTKGTHGNRAAVRDARKSDKPQA